MKRGRFINGILKRGGSLQGQPIFILSISVIGLSGIVAQVMLLRELLVSLYGNELTIGIILANWIISEGLGAILLGRLIERVKDKINVFIMLQVVFSLILPAAIYFCRTFKTLSGVPYGQGIGLGAIFLSSFLIILPVGFCHGGLFACLCKLGASYTKERELSLGKVYFWETIGSIAGGLAFTYIFARYFNSFQAALLITIANLAICIFFLGKNKPAYKYAVILLIIVVCYLYPSGIVNAIHRFSLKEQWKPHNLVDYRNSVYGNIAVTEEGGQSTFFYNGLPIITTPYPDITFMQEFGNLPLLFHGNPGDILIIGAGAGGLINEAIKHPLNKIDYAELDPLIIRILEKHPSALTNRELSDKRVRIIPQDGRFFVYNSRNKYDVIMIGLSNPSELSTNRFFTAEFFFSLKMRLNPQGVIAFWLPGSSSYIGPDLKDLNGCILNAAKTAYPYLRVIPGDYNIVMASGDSGINKVDAALVYGRLIKRNIKTAILTSKYLEYRLSGERITWFNRAMAGATKEINYDLAPFAVFQALIIWSKQFSSHFVYILESLKGLQLRHIFMIIACLALLVNFLFRRSILKAGVGYAILTTGFYGMTANLILIFSFQAFYGYLYYNIGLLLSLFMAGIALGSIYITGNLAKIKDPAGCLIVIETLTGVFAFILGLTLLAGSAHARLAPYSTFIILFFIAGLPIGLEFPLAGKIYLEGRQNTGKVAGVLYFLDLFGGWFAGILAGVVLIPVLGVFATCIALVLIKLSSVGLLFMAHIPGASRNCASIAPVGKKG
jgi:spermidine synthase